MISLGHARNYSKRRFSFRANGSGLWDDVQESKARKGEGEKSTPKACSGGGGLHETKTIVQ